MRPDAEQLITLPGPVNLGATLTTWRSGRDQTARTLEGVVWRTTRLDETPATVGFHLDAPGRVVVRCWGPGAEALLARAPAMLGADDDPASFRPEAPLLRKLAAKKPGLRLGRLPRVFEPLLVAILQQRVTGREASASYQDLVRSHGEVAPGPEHLMLPPAPRWLAKLPDHDLRAAGVDFERARVVRFVAKRSRRIEGLVELPIADAYARLMAFRGIGPWTAGLVGGLALGDRDAVVVGDYHIKNTIAWALAGEERATDERMVELLEPYRGHRFRVLRLVKGSHMHAPRYGPKRAGLHGKRRRGGRS